MPFSERIKEEVRNSSRNCCVICKKFFQPCEIHHIISESKGGPNTFENAVLLCRNHHGEFGHNTEFIKYIKKERKKWYNFCKLYLVDPKEIEKRIEKIENNIEVLKKQQNTFNIEDTRHTLIKGINNLILDLQDAKKMLTKTKVTPTDISIVSLYLSGQSIDADALGSYGISSVDGEIKSSPTFSNQKCQICGHLIPDDSAECPYCKYGFKDKYFPR